MNTNIAAIGSLYGTDLVEITADLDRVGSGGFWFIAGWFDGPILGFKFANWTDSVPLAGIWDGPTEWASDMTSESYIQKVLQAQTEIERGNVYEVNVCRQLSANWPNPAAQDSLALYQKILQDHPASHAAYLRVSSAELLKFGLPSEIEIISASPENFLQLDGNKISSTPIKGTTAPADEFLDKDISENIMIVDLVRNDLSRICEVNSVQVEDLLKRVEIPGISHLVTTVSGVLNPSTSWKEIFAASFPPGSVTGAPKKSALELIANLENSRNIYCGTLGFIDSDNRKAKLSVAIRTFWRAEGKIKFGTGAGITWGSDPAGEWAETELKAKRLIRIASQRIIGSADVD